MLKLSILIFALSALGGLVLAIRHFGGKGRPWPLSLLHGGLGAAGLVLLLIPILDGSAPSLGKIALGLFVVAALGGFLLFGFHLQGRRLPSPVVLIHGGVAVIAFVILLFGVFA
jgi:hypothetical protein